MYDETNCECMCNKRHSMTAEQDINMAASDTQTYTHTQQTGETWNDGTEHTTRLEITSVPKSWCCDWGSPPPEALGGNCQQALQITSNVSVNKSVLSYLHMLTTWHSPHLLLCTMLRHRPCSNRLISPTRQVHSSKPTAHCWSRRMDSQTYGHHIIT